MSGKIFSKNLVLKSAMALSILIFSLFVITGCNQDDPLDPYRDKGTPLVQYITPKEGTVGTLVTAVGEQFGTTKGSGTVRVFCGADGSALEANIVGWNDGQIAFRIPSAQVLDTQVVLEVTNDRDLTCPFPVYITIKSTEE